MIEALIATGAFIFGYFFGRAGERVYWLTLLNNLHAESLAKKTGEGTITAKDLYPRKD